MSRRRTAPVLPEGLTDATYTKLLQSKSGRVTVPLEISYERMFEALLAGLRRRAAKDGLRVITNRRDVPIGQRVFERRERRR